MFALVSFETWPELPWYDKLRAYFRRESRITVGHERRWGLRCLRVHIVFTCRQRAASRERQMHHALTYIAEQDIRYIVLPESCEYACLLSEHGLLQPDPARLLSQAAARLLLHTAGERGIRLNASKLTVITPRMTIEAILAVRDLCRRVKSLALDAGCDTQLMAQQLRRDYGISVLERPTPEQRADTDIYLLFDAPARDMELCPRTGSLVMVLGKEWGPLPQSGVTFIDGAKFEFPLEARHGLPPGVDTQQVLALLVDLNVVASEKMQIKALTYKGKRVW